MNECINASNRYIEFKKERERKINSISQRYYNRVRGRFIGDTKRQEALFVTGAKRLIWYI